MAFLEKQKETSEAFIALLIDEKTVQTAVWQIKEGKTKVLSIGEQQSWEGKEVVDLAETVDVSLASAVSKLPEIGVKEPEKVIFGLPSPWTKEGKITDEKLELLHQFSKKLSLKPVGFVVLAEALGHFLKIQEGVPLSAILIGLNSEKIEVSLIHLGKVLGTEAVARSDNLALDVEEGLLRFPQEETFPPRIILYGEDDLESAKQTLVSYPWQEPERNLPFLHFPRVEVAPENLAVNALCLAGGTEIGKSEELVLESKEVKGKEEAPDEKPDLGFTVGRDVLEERELRVENREREIEKERGEKREEKVEQVAQVEQVEEIGKATRAKSLVSLILAKIKLLRFKLPKLGLPTFAFGPPKLVFVGLFLIIFAGLFWAYRTIPKAQVTIFVSPEELKEELSLTLNPKATSWDKERKVLPAQSLEATVSQSKTKMTTGKKIIGEKAKGEVIIYNRTDEEKTFTTGSSLVGPGGLKFVLESEVTVVAKTPDLASGVDKWGEAKVSVTAAEIGAEYNLAADSQFSFKEFSSSLYLAKNTAAFSGGTSRQVQVVSEEDRASLKKDLEGEIIKKAKEEILKKVSQGEYFIEESLQTKISQENYDRKVGEETQEVSLDLAIQARGLVFEENVLKDFLRLLLEDRIGEQDFVWDKAGLNFAVVKVNEDSSIQFKVGLKGELYPALSKEEIAQNLAGKSWDFQKNYLNKLPKMTSFETKITPAFFTRFGRLPSLEKNIKVEIKAK